MRLEIKNLSINTLYFFEKNIYNLIIKYDWGWNI